MWAGIRALILGSWLLGDIHLSQVSAFNLEDTSVLRKNGEPDSLFGFSIAMHHQMRPTEQQFLLVGAPRAKAFLNQKLDITGGLYRCKFTPQTDDCERIPVDATPADEENRKENQWLGVRVQSQGQGGKVVVCAHRFQHFTFGRQLVLGRCFILQENLNMKDTRTFCQNRIGDKDLFGYCQQGLSAAFAKDRKYVLFGAPGAYEWKGTVRMEPVEDVTLDSFEAGDQNERIPLNINSYLGFALDSGTNLIEKEQQIIVAGAPRSNFSGEVLLLRPDAAGGKRALSVAHTLTGPGLASSFGYSLAVVDINADGWDDIIVGAPQFASTDVDADVGGAVYVYIQRRGIQWDKMKSTVLHGSRASMFGLVVASAGDVNHDGYNDFAVGAPYDVKDGAVYIYFGSTGKFSGKPQQVLHGSTHDIKLFGYSLAGNMDIDGNGYPDLAVGSLSNSVVVFRAKPVINIEKTLELTPNMIDYYGQDCQKGHCQVTADFCFSFTTYPATYNPKPSIFYNLVADEGHFGRAPRVTIPSVFMNIIELDQQGKKHCFKTNLRLLGNIADKLTDIPVSLSVDLLPDIASQPVGQSSFPPLKSILKPLGDDETTTAKIKFLNTGCRSDGICQSDLQLRYSFCSKDDHQDKCTPLVREHGSAVISPSDKNPALKIKVTNKEGDDAHLTRLAASFPQALPLSSIIPAQDSKTQVDCIVHGNKTNIECQLGNPLKRGEEVALYLMLNTERLTADTTAANITLNLNTISKQNISQIVAEAKVVFDMELQVTGAAKPSQMYFGGATKEEKAIKSLEEIGATVQYEFRIRNMGSPLKNFGSATLNVQWPKKHKDGKWLLYLVKITGPKNETVPCSPRAEISPLEHIKTASRGKRQVDGEAKVDALSFDGLTSLFGRKNYEYLTCADKLNCVEFRCPLVVVDSSAVVIFHAHVWNSTFVKDYSSLNYVDIVLNASLSLDGPQKNMRLRQSYTLVKLTLFPEKEPLLSQAPWWVTFLSVILALLLLVLLNYILCKFGCFNCEMCKDDKKGYYAINHNNAAT